MQARRPACPQPNGSASGDAPLRCGGDVELVLAPGMVVDANDLSVRHSTLAISPDAGDDTPETLHVRLVGRMRHARISTRWQAPRR